jgi:hypothetical protein
VVMVVRLNLREPPSTGQPAVGVILGRQDKTGLLRLAF